MEKKEKSKVDIAKKVLKIMMKILYQLLIFLCVILIIIIVMQRITDSNRSFYGYRLFRIISGSMIPKFNVGEIVICRETPGDEIKIGDAIVYRGKIGELNNKLVMHEVVAVNHDEVNGELEFYAKGINNNEEDPKVTTDQILGVVKFKSGALTVLYSLATSIYSSFVIVTVLVINVFISFKVPREPRRPRQLVESEIKQNENVIIETVAKNDNEVSNKNVENKKQDDENVKAEENNKIEISNKEQQDKKVQDVEDNKSSKDKEVSKKDAKTKTVKDNKEDNKNDNKEINKKKITNKEKAESSNKKENEKEIKKDVSEEKKQKQKNQKNINNVKP